MAKHPYILSFDEAESAQYVLLGGKGASLASMSRAGFPVPPGFCITTEAYAHALQPLREAVLTRVSAIDPAQSSQLDAAAAELRQQIEQMDIPSEVEQAIRARYQALCQHCGYQNDLPVAVRSSATAEDLPEASFAGQQDTYLWVVGADAVVQHVRRCWASLFTARAIAYRKDHQIPEADLLMSVVVQKMVNARVAGVAMTLNPSNGDRSKIAIDSAWGLGEAVVSGEVTPDHFLVDKVILEMVSSRIHPQAFALIPKPDLCCVEKQPLSPEKAEQPTLTQPELKELCHLAKKIEKHYGCPQDIEWALDQDMPEGQSLMLLQSRPETVWSQKKPAAKPSAYGLGMEGLVGTLLNPLNQQGGKQKGG